MRGYDAAAVIVSDIHFSHKAPVCRRETGASWYMVMQSLCKELADLVSMGHHEPLPLVIAGDIFHRYDERPELVNFLLENLPNTKIFAIPGNHDLPNHNLQLVKQSSYHTLEAAGKIVTLSNRGTRISPKWCSTEVVAWGFPYGYDLHAIVGDKGVWENSYNIAVVHRYLWIDGTGHPGAKEKDRADNLVNYTGFDALFFGDNHTKARTTAPNGTPIINCGGLLRRTVLEVDHQPTAYKLWCSTQQRKLIIKEHPLKYADKDQIIQKEMEEQPAGKEFEELITILKNMKTESLDFKKAIYNVLHSEEIRISNKCKILINKIIGE